jgi:predicted deacetylase
VLLIEHTHRNRRTRGYHRYCSTAAATHSRERAVLSVQSVKTQVQHLNDARQHGLQYPASLALASFTMVGSLADSALLSSNFTC